MNTTRKAFQVRGMTDEVTTCELCGRAELRGTVQMIEQDLDGNPIRDHYYGTGCAAKAAGWTQREVVRRVKAAEQATREAEVAERAAIQGETDRAYAAYLLATYGTADGRAIMDRLGLRTARKLLEGFDAYRAEQVAAGPAPAVEQAPQQLTLAGMPADSQQLALFV
ncbi:hypothetical protein [Streptomyces nigrescens]